MKRNVLAVFCLVFALMLGVNAQEVKSNSKGPYIQFDEKLDHSNGSVTYNYGKIVKLSDGTCVFKFKNTGKTPLILTEVKASCGCTVPTWPQNTPIMPGKSGEISVKYNTSAMGSFNKSITVTSNALNNSVELRIKGEVIEKPNDAMPVRPADAESGAPFNRK